MWGCSCVWVSVCVCACVLISPCLWAFCLFVCQQVLFSAPALYVVKMRCQCLRSLCCCWHAHTGTHTHTGYTHRHTYFRHTHLAKWCSNKSYLHTRRHNLTLTGALLMTECILIQKQFANSRKMHVKLGSCWKAVMGIAKDPQTKSRTVTSAHAKLMTFNWKIPFKWWWNNEVEWQTGWGD